MSYKYERAVPNSTFYSNDTCGLPREDAFKLFRDPVSGDIPWPGIPGLVLNSIWYWCADQVREIIFYFNTYIKSMDLNIELF